VDYFFQIGISETGNLIDKRIDTTKNSKRRRISHLEKKVEGTVPMTVENVRVEQDTKSPILEGRENTSPIDMEKVNDTLSPNSGLRNSITMNSLVLSEKGKKRN
jgi:phage gp37-like protein